LLKKVELKFGHDRTAGMGTGIYCVRQLELSLSSSSATLSIPASSRSSFTFTVLNSAELCDGPWTAALNHSFFVHANPHKSTSRKVKICLDGHHAVYKSEGGHAGLGKALRVNKRGEQPTSKHAGAGYFRADTRKWAARLMFKADPGAGKQMYLGQFGEEEQAHLAYEKALPIVLQGRREEKIKKELKEWKDGVEGVS
jgi:hypothetical protein